MFIEQFLKNYVFLIFSHNFVTPISNPIISIILKYYLHSNIYILIFYIQLFTLHKKRSFSLRISLVNMTKSAEICGLVHIY